MNNIGWFPRCFDESAGLNYVDYDYHINARLRKH